MSSPAGDEGHGQQRELGDIEALILIHSRRESTAAQEVAGIQELLEQILAELDIVSLTRAMRVSKHFNVTINHAPGTQETLLRRHRPSSSFIPDKTTIFSPNTPGLNPFLARYIPPMLISSRSFLRYMASCPHALACRSLPRSQRTQDSMHAFMEDNGTHDVKPLEGEQYLFELLAFEAKSANSVGCHDFHMHLLAKKTSRRGGLEQVYCGRNGLLKTLLCEYKIEHDWAITVQSQGWEFTVIKSRHLNGRTEAWTVKKKGWKTRVSVLEDDVPINESIGEILLWLEGHMKKEKKKDVLTTKPLLVWALSAAATATVLGVAICRVAGRSR